MKNFTANYSNTNHNFVIQNLLGERIENKFLSSICIIKNIIQRGCPTIASKFIISKLGEIDFKKVYPLISQTPPKWERIIRGDRKNNYFPAQKFFDHLIPKYFSEYPFIKSLILPEAFITEILPDVSEEFTARQVDFYLPQAKLVIEIDGSQHQLEGATDN